MGFFNVYQYAAPVVVLPLSYWLWLERCGGEHRLAALMLAIPVLYAYIVPAVGTNVLRIWEFNTRLRLGRFRPHHGFVFGSATSLIALAALPTGMHGPWEVLRAGFVLGSVLGFWNWFYDVEALRAGFLRVYTHSYAQRRGPEAIAMDYAPPIFGLFGVCYGIAVALAETTLIDPTRWDLYWGFAFLSMALCIALPVGGYVAWSYWRTGANGLKSYEGAA
ncbi:MAG: hypothetical protein ACKVQQ_15550 [Burkholderiales bacterium]